MKSINKIREVLQACNQTKTNPTISVINNACYEIEAEIAERYMELPVDADNVPIHVGEMVCGKYLNGNPGFTVRGFSFDMEHGQWNVQVSDAMWMSANLLSHVKPRTLEDVLRDVWDEALDYAKSDMWRNPDDVFAERADEIRELLGGDAE